MIFKINPLLLTITSKKILLASEYSVRIICANKTRQGYVRKRILKLAGYLFLGDAK
ncbi:MAG: hypothetical protein ACXU7H_12185 [Burkholderiaceae bacterium]